MPLGLNTANVVATSNSSRVTTECSQLVARGFAVAAAARVLQISRQVIYRMPTPRRRRSAGRSPSRTTRRCHSATSSVEHGAGDEARRRSWRVSSAGRLGSRTRRGSLTEWLVVGKTGRVECLNVQLREPLPLLIGDLEVSMCPDEMVKAQFAREAVGSSERFRSERRSGARRGAVRVGK